MITLLITILPSLAILSYFVYSDKFREPKKIIIITFLFGILITLPAGYLNSYIIKTFSTGEIVNDALLRGFFSGGLVEETLKFLVMYLYVFREKAFNEPMDGIVYGVSISLGFATLENYEYVFWMAESYNVSSLQMAIGRSYSAIPLHAFCGVIMGFYFSFYSFKGDKKYLILSWIVPYLFHACYNFLVSIGTYHYLIVLLILIIFSILLYKTLKNQQNLKKKEHEDKII